MKTLNDLTSGIYYKLHTNPMPDCADNLGFDDEQFNLRGGSVTASSGEEEAAEANGPISSEQLGEGEFRVGGNTCARRLFDCPPWGECHQTWCCTQERRDLLV